MLIVRREPDGRFTADTFDTLPADSAAATGAELIWEARLHAEQAEVDAIAAHELTQTRERDALTAQRDAGRRARADAQVAELAARGAAELVAVEARDRRTEAEGLAVAMRATARKDRLLTGRT